MKELDSIPWKDQDPIWSELADVCSTAALSPGKKPPASPGNNHLLSSFLRIIDSFSVFSVANPITRLSFR